MIAIIDYGVGNLFSLSASLSFLGLESVITNDKETIEKASHIILPGVGAFGNAIQKLTDTGLIPTLLAQAKRGVPFLGICLGMQLLFEESLEYGNHKGLGLIKGRVAPILTDLSTPLKVPHMGWNNLDILQENNPILKYTKNGDSVYYVHSFYAKACEESTVAVSDYGIKITGVVANGNVFGTQFHPEKSGKVGLSILRAFAETTPFSEPTLHKGS